MTKWILAAGAAALAIVTPALAEKGGQGGDKGKQGQSANAGGGGKDRAKGGGGDRSMKADRAGGREARAERPGKQRFAQRDDRGKQQKAFARNDRSDRRDDRAVFRNADRNGDFDRRDFGDRDRFVPRWTNAGLVRGLIDGCPPGLDKKDNGCLPPGQAKKIGTLFPNSLSGAMLDGPYRHWYQDNDQYYYRNDGDYIYRVRREGGLIDALFPSNDRDYYYYPVGMNYPSDYNFYNVPSQYSSFYPDGGDYNYRYGDGAIYQVNRSSGLISGIAALLAGDLSVGQQMPNSYNAYNVPMSYRDQYADTNQDWYRYNDGYIYRVDPTTQLVTALIKALV